MGKIKWTKPSGLKIVTNDMDVTVEYCESLGWKRDNGKKQRKKKFTIDTEQSPDTNSLPDSSASGAVTDIPNESNR